MTDTFRTDETLGTKEADASALSWAAVVAGGIAAAALTLLLLAFGSAMGFSSVSPWSNSGAAASTFKMATGIYLIVVAMLSSTIGGYIAGRLRTRWVGVHSEEVLFRDTAHGFLAWCFATILGAAALGTAATYIVGGAATGTAQSANQPGAQSAAPVDYFVDMLFRASGQGSAAQAAGSDPASARSQARLIFTRAATERTDLPSADRSYLSQLVASRTGLPAAEADKRVSDVIDQAKTAADKARKSAAALSMWLTAAMLVGAFSASLAALEGGQLRDGRWKGVIGGKNYRAAQFR
jgi:hypothetical protein